MLYLILSVFSFSFLAATEEPVCKKCELIREYNAAHPENNYYWYDDYLKAQEKKGDVADSSEKPKLACGICGDKKKKKNKENPRLACGICGDKKKDKDPERREI